MFVPFKCKECHSEKHEYPFNLMIHLGELEKGYHSFVCTNSHKVTVVPDASKHSLLIEIAILAFASRFYRETVASMASALESFQQFYLYTISNEDKIKDETFRKTWKNLSNSSERQLGSYYLTYMLKNNIIPPSLSNNMVSFRNKVIHKGHIPNQKDTLNYGGQVFNIIGKVIETLPLNYSSALDNWHKYQMLTVIDSVPNDYQNHEIHIESCIDNSLKYGHDINKNLFENICYRTVQNANLK